MVTGLDAVAINLATAMTCGAVIGSERQVRQRMAGLRTNALVALGAAAFVTFSGLYPDEVSPTRVAAQIVSGIGFLGAGLIFRDGFNIHGINTAATLWCSAAVGMMAGAGAFLHSAMLTGFVVFVNLGLRPVVKWIKRKTRAGVPMARTFRVTVRCRPEAEGEIRALILRVLSLGGLHLSGIEARGQMDGTVELTAIAGGEGVTDAAFEQAAQRIAVEPGLAGVSWQPVDDS